MNRFKDIFLIYVDKGNFVEKTKLSLLSRTLFKDEAERKSQNLPEIFNPSSQEKQKQSSVQAQQQAEAVSKRPFFNPKAPRPRLAGLPFGFKPAKPKVKEPRESFNISKFSRKGSTKFLPPRLKYFGAKLEEEKTITPQAITTVEELSTMSTLGQEFHETTFDMTPSKMTTAKMESTMATGSSTTTATTMTSTRETTQRARTKERGNGAVRRRKPVGQVTTVTSRSSETGMTEPIEPVTNTDNEDMSTQEWVNVDDLTTMIDDAFTMSDAMISTTQEDTTTTTTFTTTTSSTLSSSSTSKKQEVKKEQAPAKSRGRGRTRGRFGVGEKRKSSLTKTNSENTVNKSVIESSEGGRTRGRVRGRGRQRKAQASESKNNSVDSLQDKPIRNKTPLKMKDEGSRNEHTEKKVQTPRLRGRNMGSHRFATRKNVRLQSEAVEEEVRATAPDFRGSRRRLGDISLENNKKIKNEKVRSQEKEIRGSNSSNNEISSSLDNEMTSVSSKATSTDNISKQVGPNGGFGRKFQMKKKADTPVEEDKVIKVTAETNVVSGRQRGRFTKKKTEESSTLDSAKSRVFIRRTGVRANKIRPRHRGTESEETNAIITQSEQGLLKKGKKESTKMSVRSRSSRRQFQNRLEKGSERKEEKTKVVPTARGRGRARGRFVKNPTSATTNTAETTLSTTAKTIISSSTTASTTINVSTFTANPTTTNTNDGAANETNEETSTLTAETETGFDDSDATEYHFFPAESDTSKEKYKEQQETAAVTETQVESDHGDTFVTIEEEDDLSQHLNSALNLATVTWTQVTR